MAGGIDIELVFDRFIGEGNEINQLQATLELLAPDWNTGAHVHVGPNQQEPVDLGAPDGLRKATQMEAFRRGPVYAGMVAQHGVGDERRFGMAEIRGASPALTVVINLDEVPMARMRDGSLSFGNTISLQIRRHLVEGTPASVWAHKAVCALAGVLKPVWGRASASDEYADKVMGHYMNGSWGAVGRDLGRFLPGLFWLNVFGEPYTQLFTSTIMNAPAEVSEANQVFILRLSDDPLAWENDEYRQVEKAVEQHLGSDLFFDKSNPDQPTRAPDWLL